MPGTRPPFDPYALLAALDRRHVSYVVIGAFARVIRGADEMTDGVDVVPSSRPENLRRLEHALEDLHAQRVDARGAIVDDVAIADEPVIQFTTEEGELKVVPQPAGTRGGYDDLRRGATREPIGKGLRPSVASIADLARIAHTESPGDRHVGRTTPGRLGRQPGASANYSVSALSSASASSRCAADS